MKFLFLAAALIPFAAFAGLDTTREVVLETKSINNATHWEPEKIEVQPGEKIHVVAKHDLKGGFDFHGLYIPVLKIQKQVNRGKPESFDVTIPKDLKPGEYDVKCHLHPTHVGAKLVVKAAPKT